MLTNTILTVLFILSTMLVNNQLLLLMKKYTLLTLLLGLFVSCEKTIAPVPYGMIGFTWDGKALREGQHYNLVDNPTLFRTAIPVSMTINAFDESGCKANLFDPQTQIVRVVVWTDGEDLEFLKKLNNCELLSQHLDKYAKESEWKIIVRQTRIIALHGAPPPGIAISQNQEKVIYSNVPRKIRAEDLFQEGPLLKETY